ncbi:sensor histidine kinase [Edaphobacter modestus]|uniref:Histidine kinase n=1 Tax=Edaphobacter modestus TaxID=388466 RepID=A0A4V2G569_9BACT|nr:histidine kinase [Edaphobacter modestus]RZU43076.1 histidine kinase [Edaphobacter modestus]
MGTMREAIVAPSLHEAVTAPNSFHPRGLKDVRPNSYAIIFSISGALSLATASECNSITHLPSLLYGVTLWGWWGLLASVLWMVGRKLPALKLFSPKIVIVHLCLAPLLAWLHLLLLWSISFTVPLAQRADVPQSEWNRLIEINRFGIEFLIYGFIVGAIGAVQYHVRSQYEAIRSSDLQRQLAAAQLQALQMQLEPHFLFNTLNAITTLVELGRSQEAARMLAHLNTILKSTLASATPQKVPLSKELEIVDNYLAIEQVRFADRLTVELKVDQGALGGLVPSFLLQPIVENAIRHGIAHCEGRGLIEASIRRDGEMLRLRIRDTGLGTKAPPGNGSGIGLRNTRERLNHFYEDRFEMKAEPILTGGFEVAISIPYEQ